MNDTRGSGPATNGVAGNGSPGNSSNGASPGRTQPTVVPGGGANGEDILVWPDGRIVTLPGRASAPTTTAVPVPN